LRQRLRIEASVPATFINIGMTKYLRAAYRSLEKNEILMIPGDGRGGTNPIGNKYVQITFLGQKTYFPRGPIVLARKTGAMMLPLFCYHLEGGKQCIEIHHPLQLSFSKNVEDDIQRNTQLYADFLSQGVIDHPEHWMFWEEFAPGQMIRDKA
jgi:lauroyl/myristoyl acyltransferase